MGVTRVALLRFVGHCLRVAGEDGVGGINGDAEPAQGEAGELDAVQRLMKDRDGNQQIAGSG